MTESKTENNRYFYSFSNLHEWAPAFKYYVTFGSYSYVVPFLRNLLVLNVELTLLLYLGRSSFTNKEFFVF